MLNSLKSLTLRYSICNAIKKCVVKAVISLIVSVGSVGEGQTFLVGEIYAREVDENGFFQEGS